MPEVVPLPGAMRVFERGWVSSNNILFMDDRETVLVDTGYGRHADLTLRLVGHALDGRALDRVVNTHTHSDHIGGNAALSRAYPGLHITIPEGEVEAVRDWNEDLLHLAPMGQECEPFRFDATLAAGATQLLGGMEWRAIASPGHDMESLMLWCEAERILIAADALWEHGFGVIFPALPPYDDYTAFDAQAATLDTIAKLAPRLVIPGHGAPFTDVAGALERARGRLAYFAADPARNTRNGAKVTLAFLLMIEGRLPLETLAARLDGLKLAAAANRKVYGLDPQAFADTLVADLVKAGAARCADGFLWSAGA